MFWNQYPYINLNDLNLDFLLKAIGEMQNEVKNFVTLNAVKYADPIQWDITSQYEKNTIVIDPLTGTAYISVQPVPSGVALNRTEYWTPVFDLSRFITQGNKNLTEHVEAEGVIYSTFALNHGDWVVWNGELYKALVNMPIGTAYSVDGNIERITIEDVINAIVQEIANEVQARQDADTAINNTIGDLNDLSTTDKSSIVNAINDEVQKRQDAIDDEVQARQDADNTLQEDIGDLNNLQTVDKSNLVAAINEALDNSAIEIVTPKMFGALADGVHDDTAAINEALATSKMVYFPNGIYRTTSTINIPIGSHLFGNIYNAASGNTYGATILHDGNGDTLNIQNYSPCIIENLMIDKVNSIDGHGVHAALVDNFIINNVRVINHGVGIYIDGTSFGTVRGCVCERNYFDGFYFTNNETLNTCQVQVLDCLSELNNGNGFQFVSKRPTMPIGKFDGNKTFANTTGGVVFQSTDANYKITGVYISNCFIGSDGYLGGIYLDKMGYPANIVNCYFEESGMSPTGREYNTPASNIGYGIYIPANNTQGATITGCTFATSAYSGVSLSSRAMISNCSFVNNGLSPSATATQKCGLLIFNTECVISNCDFVSGEDGIYVYSSDSVKIIGNRFATTNPIQNAQTATQIRFNIGVADAN